MKHIKQYEQLTYKNEKLTLDYLIYERYWKIVNEANETLYWKFEEIPNNNQDFYFTVYYEDDRNPPYFNIFTINQVMFIINNSNAEIKPLSPEEIKLFELKIFSAKYNL